MHVVERSSGERVTTIQDMSFEGHKFASIEINKTCTNFANLWAQNLGSFETFIYNVKKLYK